MRPLQSSAELLQRALLPLRTGGMVNGECFAYSYFLEQRAQCSYVQVGEALGLGGGEWGGRRMSTTCFLQSAACLLRGLLCRNKAGRRVMMAVQQPCGSSMYS